MGKLMDNLNKQLESEHYKEEAKDCILILNKLKEITGYVWNGDWSVLIRTFYTNNYKKAIHEPSEIGKVFLDGIRGKSC
jgi:hypothetical protein